MSSTFVGSRHRRRFRPLRTIGLGVEGLESRRLLAASPVNLSSSLEFSTILPEPGLGTNIGVATPIGTELILIEEDLSAVAGLPVPGLEDGLGLPLVGFDTGVGLATPAQTLSNVPMSVSTLPSGSSTAGMSFGSMATGPATTLGTIRSVSQTADAAASEVAQPTPGTSDRISSLIVAPPMILLPHFGTPAPKAAPAPAPKVKARSPVEGPFLPARPATEPIKPTTPEDSARPAEPAIPARPTESDKPPIADPTPAEPKGLTSFQVWDAALDLAETNLTEVSPALLAEHSEGAMAVGALLAAWGGWAHRTRPEGKSRRKAVPIQVHEAGPGNGDGR